MRDVMRLFDAIPEVDYAWPSISARDLDPRTAGLEIEAISLDCFSRHLQDEVREVAHVAPLLEIFEAVAGGSLVGPPGVQHHRLHRRPAAARARDDRSHHATWSRRVCRCWSCPCHSAERRRRSPCWAPASSTWRSCSAPWCCSSWLSPAAASSPAWARRSPNMAHRRLPVRRSGDRSHQRHRHRDEQVLRPAGHRQRWDRRCQGEQLAGRRRRHARRPRLRLWPGRTACSPSASSTARRP